MIAGENALRRFAWEEAVTQFERALSVKNDKDDDEAAACYMTSPALCCSWAKPVRLQFILNEHLHITFKPRT